MTYEFTEVQLLNSSIVRAKELELRFPPPPYAFAIAAVLVALSVVLKQIFRIPRCMKTTAPMGLNPAAALLRLNSTPISWLNSECPSALIARHSPYNPLPS
uniref:Uncharacterized protein n=1 Tax=Arundo donax TaxID=35708 RepID=A0A0A9F2U5_ARUDO